MNFRALLQSCCLLALASAAQATPFDFSDLKALIDHGQLHSIEELLAALPADLRSRYVLVFDSRSLQSASLENPRAILYSEDAALALSFNGDARQRGHDAVETMAFDAARSRFVFREITFAAEDSGAPQPRISEANPARCLACHGSEPRPLWDTAPLWPGVYGERYHAGLSAPEHDGMQRFLSAQKTHPRYRFLLDAARFADRDTYVPSSRALYGGEVREPPNAEFGDLLWRLNVRQIIQQVAAHPAFAQYRYLLLAAVSSECGAIEDFVAGAGRPGLATALKDFQERAHATQARQSQAKLSRAISPPAYQAGLTASGLTRLRFVVEQELGYSTSAWTLALENGSFDFSTASGTNELARALYDAVAAQDSTLATLAQNPGPQASDAYCNYLRTQSRRALQATAPDAQRPQPLPREASAVRPPLLQKCAGCHDGDVAPNLPFEDEPSLSSALGQGRYPRGRLLDEILYRLAPESGAARMPRGLSTSEDQRHALEAYFLQLAANGPSQ